VRANENGFSPPVAKLPLNCDGGNRTIGIRDWMSVEALNYVLSLRSRNVSASEISGTFRSNVSAGLVISYSPSIEG
jgi:hypothetical protein